MSLFGINAAQAEVIQTQMLYDAMTPEEQERVIMARGQRRLAALQKARQRRIKAWFICAVGLLLLVAFHH